MIIIIFALRYPTMKEARLPKFSILYLISFIEGGALMAVELAGAKMIAPYYGNSLYVWTAVLATTLGGLALGYYLGGKLSEKQPTIKTLNKIIALSALVVGLMPFLGPLIMEATLNMELRLGITISCLFLLTPLLALFGIVSPVIINLLATDIKLVGRAAGTIYAVSTLGGIIFTFFMGFYSIPYLGIRFSVFSTAIALAIFPFLFLIGNINRGKTSALPK